MKDCYYDLRLHFILLDESPQSYILKLRDKDPATGLFPELLLDDHRKAFSLKLQGER